jgi:CRP-like cAMP-binding protein
MTIEDDIAFLERVPTFAQLGFAALQIVAIGSEAKQLKSDEVLFRAGDTADAGYVVQAGTLKLERPDGRSAEREVTVGPGVLLGELALLTETVRPVTATAIEPSIVMRISRSLFSKVLEGFPDAARIMRDQLAERANQMTAEIGAVRGTLDRDGRKP